MSESVAEFTVETFTERISTARASTVRRLLAEELDTDAPRQGILDAGYARLNELGESTDAVGMSAPGDKIPGTVGVGEGPVGVQAVYINGTAVEVGDRVHVVHDRPESFASGAIFTVAVVNDGNAEGKVVGLEAPEPFVVGNSLDGAVADNTGWWALPSSLEKIAE